MASKRFFAPSCSTGYQGKIQHKNTPSGDNEQNPRVCANRTLRVCPRTKKQSTGLFFAHCGAPSCSTGHQGKIQNKNLAGRRQGFCFGAADGSRTHLSSLGSLHSTDELQPRKAMAQDIPAPF